MKVYCDANIFMDYFIDREDYIRPLKDFAFEFFSRGWNCAFELIISDVLVSELKKHLPKEKFESIFNNFKEKNKLVYMKSEDADRREAKKKRNSEDAIHAVLAKKANAKYLATRNFKHFEDCGDLVAIVFPEYI